MRKINWTLDGVDSLNEIIEEILISKVIDNKI
jgi:hypothetical protein